MRATREQRVEQALFRGATLTIDNLIYHDAVRALTELLLRSDLAPCDLTVESLGMKGYPSSACILTREVGVAAGVAETTFLLESHGVDVMFRKNDGEALEPGDALVEAVGPAGKLLAVERVVLNLLQRMSGIATAVRSLQERVRKDGAETKIVGTRKTPWGLLDKRALHLGNRGTHRLGLGDAIIIKNNHLALLAAREEEAAHQAIERAWRFRMDSAFIEVEVRTAEAARAAARAFRRLQEEAGEEYPCLLLLDNMTPDGISGVLDMLRREGLWDHTLVEASGRISELNLEEYVASGVDAISIGALTHSTRALDMHQRIS
jgi:nicotinate-nucleotide pyrophosphorylase (carboxylating)